MHSLALHCTVCNDCFNYKPDWLRHLLQERHLILARQGLANWGENERSSVLVVFAKLPVGRDERIVQYLSKDFGTLVTDFVWWKERPRVGFVQFESSCKLQKVLGSLQNHQFQIDQDQFCQVRDGATISELEWNGLHPENETLPEHQRVNGSPERASHDKILPVLPKHFASSSRMRSKLSSIARPGLRHHLSSILEMIEIPDEEYNTILDINRRLQELLKSSEINGEKSMCKSALTRNWILKLKYPTKATYSNYTRIAILIHKELNNITRPEFRTIKGKLFQRKKNQTLFLSNIVCKLHHELNLRHFPTFDIEPTANLLFELKFVDGPILFMEDQVWCLFKYLCSFDPHCYPVLALTYYWAAANVILVGEIGGSPKNLPDPSGLNWLLMLFFQQEGHIPATNLVLEQPHRNITLYGKDIGFADSPQFSKSWRIARSTWEADTSSEKFAEEVFTLLFKFFLFCGSLLRKIQKNEEFVWILNTRDSELIPMSDIQTKNIRDCEKLKSFKLSEDELTEVRNSYDRGSNGRIAMLHPFYTNSRLSTKYAELAFSAMKKTGTRLRDYFQNGGIGMGKREKLGLDEFLNLLKIPEEAMDI